MASHLVRTARRLAMVLLGCALPAACLITPENSVGPCAEVGCDDGNACTEDVCAEDGFCDHSPAEAAPDDGNECTIDECVDSQERHTARGDGDPCGLGGQLECEGGQCSCSADAECGLDTACKSFKCESSACTTKNAQAGTPVDGAEQHDCKKTECDGEGEAALVPDLTDFAPDATPGDCKQNACDESGPVVTANADDPPPGDGNDCTLEACDGETPIVGDPLGDGSPCGAPPVCEPAGTGFQTLPQATCQAGSCAAGAPVSCGLFACNAAGDGCASTCAGDNECASAAFCSGTTCAADLNLGVACSGNSQCASGQCVDGVCCNSACGGACAACDIAGALGTCTPIATGTDPDMECPGNQVCDGGGACVKQNGDSCQGNSECLSDICEDDVCCNATCFGSCVSCNVPGSLGMCADVPAGGQTDFCFGAASCDGNGNCKLPLGVPCFNNDDCDSGHCSDEGNSQSVCCNEACDGQCRSCRADKKGGQTGTCGFIPDKTDPDGECAGTCNANGSGCCNGDGTCQQ